VLVVLVLAGLDGDVGAAEDPCEDREDDEHEHEERHDRSERGPVAVVGVDACEDQTEDHSYDQTHEAADQSEHERSQQGGAIGLVSCFEALGVTLLLDALEDVAEEDLDLGGRTVLTRVVDVPEVVLGVDACGDVGDSQEVQRLDDGLFEALDLGELEELVEGFEPPVVSGVNPFRVEHGGNCGFRVGHTTLRSPLGLLAVRDAQFAAPGVRAARQLIMYW
jgi:hypothetical protein